MRDSPTHDAQTRVIRAIVAAYHEQADSALHVNARIESALAALRQLRIDLSVLRSLAISIGEPPPTPPSLRARVGAVLIRVVRRALFWYSPRIIESQLATADAIDKHVSVCEVILDTISDVQADVAAVHKLVAEHNATSQARHKSSTDQIVKLAASLSEQQAVCTTLEHTLTTRMDELEQRCNHLEARNVELQHTLHRASINHEGEVNRFNDGMNELKHDWLHWRAVIAVQERRIGDLIEGMRAAASEGVAGSVAARLTAEAGHQLDALYLAFEDRFRGPRKEIKRRLRVYAPMVREAAIATGEALVIDLGCGRGEWLEVLKDVGVTARGVDSNRVMVMLCSSFGLDVQESDMIDVLRSTPENSLSGVTVFHVVEHLPLPTLIELLDQTVRVLRPGGIAIFETPNPENISVGAYTFYTDPTHRNPLPAPTLKFLAEERGLRQVHVSHQNPDSEIARLPDTSELNRRFNTMFYGPRDYAVIGFKV
jgi:2-polyprenyl-3-methyl-5-hydroxy-6-metoxy-1,4-benzoquinol methylase